MILGDDQPPAGRRRGVGQGGPVDGLDRVQVDDPGRDPVAGQVVGGAQALVHGDARPDQRDLVAAGGPQHLAPANRKRLPGRIENRPAARVVRR